MIDLLKTLLIVIILGWGVWTGVTLAISEIFRTDFNITYIIVGVAYIIFLFVFRWVLTAKSL